MNAPKVTLQDIEAFIVSEHYFTGADGRNGAIEAGTYVGKEVPEYMDADLKPLELLTFCVFTLANGGTIIGKSQVVSPENFNAELGRHYAREDAVRQMWQPMGFQLLTELAKQKGRL